MTWSWAVMWGGQPQQQHRHPAPGPPPPGGTQRTRAMTGGCRSKWWDMGGCRWCHNKGFKKLLLKNNIKGVLESIFHLFSIHHQFASSWILQSKINTKLALQYEAMHHWTMLGITILCVTIICAGHCSCPGPGDWGHGHGEGQSVTLKAIIFFSIQKKLLYIRKIFVYTSRNI